MLVKLTGFGNSAGFLVERGLMGMGDFASQKSTTREDIEAMTGKPLPRASGNTSAASGQAPGAGSATEEYDEAAEEEEERKAKAMMERLEDMERRGLVKLVRKGEPMPEGFSALPPKKDDPESSPSSK